MRKFPKTVGQSVFLSPVFAPHLSQNFDVSLTSGLPHPEQNFTKLIFFRFIVLYSSMNVTKIRISVETVRLHYIPARLCSPTLCHQT